MSKERSKITTADTAAANYNSWYPKGISVAKFKFWTKGESSGNGRRLGTKPKYKTWWCNQDMHATCKKNKVECECSCHVDDAA